MSVIQRTKAQGVLKVSSKKMRYRRPVGVLLCTPNPQKECRGAQVESPLKLLYGD